MRTPSGPRGKKKKSGKRPRRREKRKRRMSCTTRRVEGTEGRKEKTVFSFSSVCIAGEESNEKNRDRKRRFIDGVFVESRKGLEAESELANRARTRGQWRGILQQTPEIFVSLAFPFPIETRRKLKGCKKRAQA